jgi:hypothetical protein
VCGFLFFGCSLRLWKPKQKASANGRVKNHHRSLFRVYKGPGEIHRRLRPNPPRNSNSKVKRSFRSSNDSRTRNRRPRIAHPVALTPWQGKRHLRQVKRTPFRLYHDDRVIKGVPHYLNSYPFPLSLSLSLSLSLLPQGPGKGILRKGSFLVKETGPEPSY